MIKAVIFDKDGVLLNLEATWLNSAVAMTYFLSELTNGRHHASVFQSLIGIDEHKRSIDPDGLFAAGSMLEQIAVFVEHVPELQHHLTADETIRRKMRDVFLDARDRTLSQTGSVANGDVLTPVSALYDNGLKLAVLTNDSFSSASRGCADIGLSPYLEMIVGFDSGYGAKPEPAGFLAICDRLAIAPGEAVMVGDTHADVNVAKAAGAGGFIGISAVFPKAPRALSDCAYLLPDLTGLPDVISQMKQ